MGWFSNDDCPKCGREYTITSDGLEDFYVCWPCYRKAKKEKERAESLEERVKKLEAQLNKQNNSEHRS